MVEKQPLRRLVAGLCIPAVMWVAGCRASESPQPTSTAPAPVAAPEPQRTADPYEAEIRKFQQDREALLKTDTGWLTVAGLFFLTQPRTTFGSDPLNDIVLPAGAPARAGVFEVRGGKVFVKAAEGVSFQLDGKTITTAQLKPDSQGPPDRISLGDLMLWVHNSGDRLSIRLRDRNNPLRTSFTGTRWFPIDKKYRVQGTWIPHAKPKMIQVPNILGDIDNMPITGLVSFTLDGQEQKLEAVGEEGVPELWFIFRDLTSQDETYPAARFLYTPVAVDGKVDMDFNRAQNPPCAYNPYTTCPLPSEQNRLRVRIEAGEKKYEH